MTDVETSHSYPLSPRNRVKRLHERGSYDRTTVHGLLDASMLCHVSYVIEGQPYCTPTFFWREGERLYWHGSSASRMLENQSAGERVCLTVAHLDSLVLARCGFNHSADYRRLWRSAPLTSSPIRGEGARPRCHGRPVLSRSHRGPATKHEAGDQGDRRDRDAD